MELLVVTLAYTVPEYDADVMVRVRLVGETIQNVPGLLSSQLYHGKSTEPCYVVLSTWESESAWQQARERYSPRHLLSMSANLLTVTLEQWYMTYIWGYNRPAVQPTIANIHLATIPQDKAEVVQRGWLKGLRRQAMDSLLALAFLAQGTEDSMLTMPPVMNPNNNDPNTPTRKGKLFLNLLSWANEGDSEEYFADTDYKAIKQFIGSMGTLRILPLEPM